MMYMHPNGERLWGAFLGKAIEVRVKMCYNHSISE